MLESPDIIFGLTIDAGPEPTYEEKNESTPYPLGVVPYAILIVLMCIGKSIRISG